LIWSAIAIDVVFCVVVVALEALPAVIRQHIVASEVYRIVANERKKNPLSSLRLQSREEKNTAWKTRKCETRHRALMHGAPSEDICRSAI
jgi:hypothetical protein